MASFRKRLQAKSFRCCLRSHPPSIGRVSCSKSGSRRSWKWRRRVSSRTRKKATRFLLARRRRRRSKDLRFRRHAERSDSTFGRFFFYSVIINVSMKKILCVVDAPGPAEFIAPVIPLFRGIELRLVAVKGAPTEILKKFHPLRCDTEAEAEAIYQKHKPDALLVAMSSLMLGPYVNKRFTELFHESGKPIIAFQDYWANHRQPQNAIVQSYWDALLVPDALAERYVEEDGFHGNVYVTGNPAFEKFKNVKVADERKRLRKKFGISEAAKVIFYAGTGTPQSAGADT